MERLFIRSIKIKEVNGLKSSSKTKGNIIVLGNNNRIEPGDKRNNIVKIIFAVAFGIGILAISFAMAHRLLTVSDSVVQSILEKMLDTLFSGIEMLLH